jgi:hypothetical protein
MDDLSLVVQSLIDSELDDLVLDLVYDIHSSLKGIPDEQLEVGTHGNKTRHLSIPSSACQTIAIEKQTCSCPHCGQTNIVAIRFAYHLAKCLGEHRRVDRCVVCVVLFDGHQRSRRDRSFSFDIVIVIVRCGPTVVSSSEESHCRSSSNNNGVVR